jgi:hypothetical protein
MSEVNIRKNTILSIRIILSELGTGRDGPPVLLSCPVLQDRMNFKFCPDLPPARTHKYRTKGQDRRDQLVLY